jgi:hypothetical protein
MRVLLLLFLSAAVATLPGPFAKDYLLLSFAAYCGDRVAPNFTCYWCDKVANPFELLGVFGSHKVPGFGYVGIYNWNSILVVYRGTDTLSGFLKDAHFKQVQLPGAPTGVLVHEGFYNISQNDRTSIRDLVLEAQRRCPSCKETVVTGHSLGASLATLAAYFLAEDVGVAVPILVRNFGSPRVFNPQVN